MTPASNDASWQSPDGVRADLQRQPHLFMKLAENALTVAESLRGNYFKNTAEFVSALRAAMRRTEPILHVMPVDSMSWADVQGEVVTFIDGGVGQVQISSQVPILLRVGSYSVRTGEQRLAEREQFGYYPVILGDLEGGSKWRKDFVDIVRITAELLGGLSALERTSDLRVLMFHGPLVYLVGSYAGHTPFTEADIDLFLQHYAASPALGRALKDEFISQARLDIYPQMCPDWSDEWVRRRAFEPLAWMAFLYRRLIQSAAVRNPVPIIAGVVERSELQEYTEKVIIERIFRRLRALDTKGSVNYFNKLYGRTDLISPEAFVKKLNYTDALLLAMLLRPGEASEPWTVNKYASLHTGQMALPGEGRGYSVDWSPLAPPSSIGFPAVTACYVHESETTEPIRVEVFDNLQGNQLMEAAQRAHLYASLLPGYGFPIGLDIVDKFAKIPAWLTDAYSKLIRFHLGVSLQQGQIKDEEMRRILVQAIYMTHRDWLFRPQA